MNIVLVTGGFDPLHSGHLAYFEQARELGNKLIVGLNSDDWLARKKGRAFMAWAERARIVESLRMVDAVLEFDDSDGSACNAIQSVLDQYPDATIIFANGGDRAQDNIPEMQMSDPRLCFRFGIGGNDKKNSSSWILDEWKAPRTGRAWGYYRILHEHGAHVKVKELTVDPGMCLSMQKHSDRAEFWFVAEGTASVYTVNSRTTDVEHLGYYNTWQHLHIARGEWHRLCNETVDPLRIIEIQYGERCQEEDIQRQ